MRPSQKRKVYMGLLAVLAASLIAGLVAGYDARKSSICKDDKPPVAQEELPVGSGGTLYRCENGQVVTTDN